MSLYYFRKVLDEVSYPGFDFELQYTISYPDQSPQWRANAIWNYDLRVVCKEGLCNVSGEPMGWKGRWWRLSRHMTPTEIAGTAFKAVITALEHEAREQFTYKGVAVFDSHVDIEELVKVRLEGKLDVRLCPSCHGLNTSCPEGCGRDPLTGELDGSTLTPAPGT